MATPSTSAQQTRLMTGLFRDRESAERAYQVLSDRGYGDDDISLIMSEDTRRAHFSNGMAAKTELGNLAPEGAGVGGMVGGTLGAIAAALAAVGTSLTIPGLGLVIAGPVAAAFAGAGAGGLAGGLLGGLVGAGMPEERVKAYESGIKGGSILIGVRPQSPEDADFIEKAWRNCNAEQIYR